jgi:hypothetical protein
MLDCLRLLNNKGPCFPGLWSEEQFVTTLRTGVTLGGHQLNEFMPWRYFGQMTDDELRAFWLYLQSLPALKHGK